jgi:hypothetical protein
MSIRSPIRGSIDLATTPSVRRDNDSNHSGFREPRKRAVEPASACLVIHADGVSRDGSVIRVGLENRGCSLEQQAREFLAK